MNYRGCRQLFDFLFFCAFVFAFLTAGVPVFAHEQPPSVSPSFKGQYIRSPLQVYKAEIVVGYHNRSLKPASFQCTLPIPRSDDVHQEVFRRRFQPEPVRIEKRVSGDVAVFDVKDVKPGAKVTCTAEMYIRTHRVLYLVDAKSVTNTIPADVKPFLKPDNDFPSSTPLVLQTVANVTGSERNPYYRALKLYDFVRSFDFRLKDKPRDVLTVLKDKRCQCSDAAAVLMTLYRAAGIPARYMGGMYLKETDTSTGDTHAWVEAYFAPYGWVPIDPTMGRFDKATRLSRFSEIDSPYVLLWEGVPVPLEIRGVTISGLTTSRQHDKNGAAFVRVNYRALLPRLGVPAQAVYPQFSLSISPDARATLLSRNPQARTVFLDGVRAQRKGNLSKAESQYRQAMRLDPGFISSYLKLLQVMEKTENNTKLRRELVMWQKNRSSTAGASLALAKLAMDEQRYSDAEKELKRAREAGIPPFLGHSFQGEFYLQTKQVHRALPHINRALLEDAHGDRQFARMYDILDYLEDYESVITLSNAGFEISKDPAFIHEIALAYYYMHRQEEAVKYARRAIVLSPREGSYHGTLGRILLKMNQTGEARSELKKALQMGVPDDEKALLEELLHRRKAEE